VNFKNESRHALTNLLPAGCQWNFFSLLGQYLIA